MPLEDHELRTSESAAWKSGSLCGEDRPFSITAARSVLNVPGMWLCNAMEYRQRATCTAFGEGELKTGG